MILLLRRSTVRAVVLTAFAFLAIGIAAAAFDGSIEGSVVIGVTEPLFHYLQPYYAAFHERHPGAVVELRVIDDGHLEQASKWPPLDAVMITEDSLTALQSTSQPSQSAGAAGLVASESLYARFVPVVSAFNPTALITAEALRMALAGEIDDWASIQPGWNGKIRFLTWDANPADGLALNALEGVKRHAPMWVQLKDHDEVIDRLRYEPMGMAIIPLSMIAPGVNPIRISDGFGVSNGQLVCHVYVLERVDRSPLSWIRARLGKPRVLRAFIEYIREIDAALSGEGAVTLVAVGDVMMDRGVRLAMNERGITYPFEGTQQVLASADIAIANLETPISARGTPLNMFRAYPDVMKALRYSGIDVVSIANNHILDYDYIALSDTLIYLDSDGIAGVGAGSDEMAARRPAVIDIGGTRIAFLAYTELWFCYAKDNRPWDATATRPGVAPLREDVLIQDIARAAAIADLVVVSCHWGDEYKHYPNQTQRRFAELAINAGANIVLGHHPHVLQGIAYDRHSVVAYSLGNFVFDQRQPGTQDSVILRFTISADRIIRLELLPCCIVDCQPVLLTGEARRAALMQVIRFSGALVDGASGEP